MNNDKQELNAAFEYILNTACRTLLKDNLDPEEYWRAVLDELWNGDSYGDYYHEIRASHTKSGNPFVINV